MTHYLLSVWFDEPYEDQDLDHPDQRRQMAQTSALNDEMQAAGVWVYANGLHDPATASVVRADAGEVLTVDGPYAEAKELMAGFWILDVADREEALAWAAKATVACERPIEVRAAH